MKQRDCLRITALVAGLLLAAMLSGSGKQAQAQPKQLPTIRFVIPNVEQTRAAATGTPARPTPEPPTADYWWNQPDYIEAFGLSTDQRKRMDAAMAQTQEKANEAIRQQNEARDRFHAAVTKRDWAAARKAMEDWERAFAAQWGVGNQAKIAVLEVLTPAQHEKLLREHAYLLDRPWTLGRRIQVHRGTPASASGSTSQTPSSPTSGSSQP